MHTCEIGMWHNGGRLRNDSHWSPTGGQTLSNGMWKNSKEQETAFTTGPGPAKQPPYCLLHSVDTACPMSDQVIWQQNRPSV